MNCPRCVTKPLDEMNREGVMVDVCQACRGIWLDRGELEKLIARASTEEARYRHHHDRDDGPPSSDDRRGHHKKKRSWLDFFD